MSHDVLIYFLGFCVDTFICDTFLSVVEWRVSKQSESRFQDTYTQVRALHSLWTLWLQKTLENAMIWHINELSML